MPNNKVVAGACILALLIGTVFFLEARGRRPADGAKDNGARSIADRSPGAFPTATAQLPGSGPPAQSTWRPGGPPASAIPPSRGAGTPTVAGAGGSGGGSPAQQALAAYKQWARYPPTSRPIGEQPDQLRPHSLLATVRPLDPNRGGKATLRQEQDRLYLVPGEAAVVTLAASVGGAPATVVVAQAGLARLEGTPAVLSAPISGVTFRDDGVAPDVTANDGVLTAAVLPPVASLSGYAGDLRLTVSVRVNGEQGEASFPFIYAGVPPARFTGTVREAVEDGSLALYVGVEVHVAGRYVVVARLYDAGDRPVALLQQNDMVDVAARELRLLAFGKVLRDAGAVSPFTLRDVQGWRMAESGYPDRQLLDIWSGPYQTAAYAPTVFSDREWDSPSKRNRLAGLQQIANGPP